MTLEQIKKQILTLIEEANSTDTSISDDTDIQLKLNHIINTVQYELARIKKIPAKEDIPVTLDMEYDLEELPNFYQLNIIKGPRYEVYGKTVVFLDTMTARVHYYAYPSLVTDSTPNTLELELSDDALQVLIYGVAADLLKNDVSTSYGSIYSQRYNELKQMLDPRYSLGSFYIGGGYDI